MHLVTPTSYCHWTLTESRANPLKGRRPHTQCTHQPVPTGLPRVECSNCPATATRASRCQCAVHVSSRARTIGRPVRGGKGRVCAARSSSRATSSRAVSIASRPSASAAHRDAARFTADSAALVKLARRARPVRSAAAAFATVRVTSPTFADRMYDTITRRRPPAPQCGTCQ